MNWLKRTRSLRHDIYEVLIWIIGIGIAVALLAMSIGLLFNKPLKGSCGGQDGKCPVCGDICKSNE